MKKGILIVSYGSTRKETLKTIGKMIERVKEKYVDYEVSLAFSGKHVINILKQRDNILIDNPKVAIEKMIEKGLEEIIVQSLHILPGVEFHNMLEQVTCFKESVKIKIGWPLLTSISDYNKSVKALIENYHDLKDNEAVIFMGHGTYHPCNASYSCLQSILEDSGKNMYVANIKGYPKLENVIPKLINNKIKNIVLVPYMLTAGIHALNDMIENKNSFKNILEREGFEVDICFKGLIEDPNQQDIFLEHINDAIDGVSLKDKFE